jgi:hypothetical protein
MGKRATIDHNIRDLGKLYAASVQWGGSLRMVQGDHEIPVRIKRLASRANSTTTSFSSHFEKII